MTLWVESKAVMQSWTCQQPARGSWTWNTTGGGAQIEPLLPLEQPKLPTDLSEWVNPGLIRTWIEQEMSRLDWNNPRLVQHP